ncbi:hypothetical protein QJQ45_017993, partial [Haematococcus lacustris]
FVEWLAPPDKRISWYQLEHSANLEGQDLLPHNRAVFNNPSYLDLTTKPVEVGDMKQLENFNTSGAHLKQLAVMVQVLQGCEAGCKDTAADGLWTFPRLAKKRVFLTKTAAEMQSDVAEASGVELKKTLGVFELITMGVGFMCGAGIFVSPGYIAVALTGPSLFLAYLSAAVSAALSSFCYAEFTVSIPLAGAAYNYIYATLGELIAWITVSNLLFEYILSNAAVARGFSPYLARLFNRPSKYFYRNYKSHIMDGWACGLVLVCTAIQCWGIRESASVNNVITSIQITVLVFIIIAGLTKANKANFSPLIKPGATWKNIFNGAAVSYFSFIGFDALATTAEEQRDPSRDMPRGILGAVSIITVLYTMVCVTLSLMVPNSAIDASAAFATAFDTVGMSWAKYVVCIGALLGIFTTVFMGVLGASRILTGCSRERMLPPIFAWISKSRQAPYVATIVIGIISAGIALFSGFDELSNMVSIGTLVVFYVVAVGLLWFRCNVPGKTTFKAQCLLMLHTFAIMGFSMGFVLFWVMPEYAEKISGYDADDGSYVPEVPAGKNYNSQSKGLIAMAVLLVASIVSMTFVCKQDHVPTGYKVPLFPAIPALSIFVNTFLLGQLDVRSYERFGWWILGTVCLYFFYGMISQEAHDIALEAKMNSLPSVEEVAKVAKAASDDPSMRSDTSPSIKVATQ